MTVQGVSSWKTIRIFLILPVLGFAGFGPAVAQWTPLVLFEDRFETDQGWGMFEELVDCPPPRRPACLNTTCYGTGIGEVVRSTDVAFDGSYSLRVWANKAGSRTSNHVIAQKRISSSGLTDKLFYSVLAYIPADPANRGETGPEFSMQNTRQIAPGQFRTTTAGIQYRANPDSSQFATWALWTETGTPGPAGWTVFRTATPLSAGQWYYLAIEADYTTNTYVRFYLWGPGLQFSVDMSAYRIVQETKFNEEAFWLTLEAENKYNGCIPTSESTNYKVYYDHVLLRRVCP